MMVNLMILIPYVSSLAVEYLVLEYTQVDLGLKFAANPLSLLKAEKMNGIPMVQQHIGDQMDNIMSNMTEFLQSSYLML